MTPEQWLAIIFIVACIWAAMIFIGASIWSAIKGPDRRFPRLFPTLDEAEAQARARCDTRAVGRLMKERQDRLHGALRGVGE